MNIVTNTSCAINLIHIRNQQNKKIQINGIYV